MKLIQSRGLRGVAITFISLQPDNGSSALTSALPPSKARALICPYLSALHSEEICCQLPVFASQNVVVCDLKGRQTRVQLRNARIPLTKSGIAWTALSGGAVMFSSFPILRGGMGQKLSLDQNPPFKEPTVLPRIANNDHGQRPSLANPTNEPLTHLSLTRSSISTKKSSAPCLDSRK